MTLTWIENPEAVGLRYVGKAHEVAPANYSYLRPAVDHTGWYTDPDGMCETVTGVVYQVPGKEGRARYVVGYDDPWNDGSACLDLTTVYTGDRKDSDWEFDHALRDVARAADDHAEAFAERERNYQTAWQSGRLYYEHGEEIAKIRNTLRDILRERRTVQTADTPALCVALKAHVAGLLSRRSKLRAERAELAQGDYDGLFWWPGDDTLCDAFCDGAQIERMSA